MVWKCCGVILVFEGSISLHALLFYSENYLWLVFSTGRRFCLTKVTRCFPPLPLMRSCYWLKTNLFYLGHKRPASKVWTSYNSENAGTHYVPENEQSYMTKVGWQFQKGTFQLSLTKSNMVQVFKNGAALRKPFPLLRCYCTANTVPECVNGSPKPSSGRHKCSSRKTINTALKNWNGKFGNRKCQHTNECWSYVASSQGPTPWKIGIFGRSGWLRHGI